MHALDNMYTQLIINPTPTTNQLMIKLREKEYIVRLNVNMEGRSCCDDEGPGLTDPIRLQMGVAARKITVSFTHEYDWLEGK